jgi:Skp family chaperone for outer membrane proteins
LIAAALTIGLLASNPGSTEETTKPKHAHGSVVVLDITRLFKDSKQFKTQMESMKADVHKAEENFKNERDKIKTKREELEKLPAGSEDYLKQEEYLSKVEAAMTASVSLQKTTFLRREAAIYMNFYKRIEAEVEAYAKENGIDIVLRMQNDTADASKPESILQHLNRDIVWASPDADISTAISERLDRHKDSPEENGK